jgi:hypothetical protein
MNKESNGEKKFWTIQKKILWTSATLVSLGTLMIMLRPSCNSAVAGPAIDTHKIKFEELHQPIIDTQKKQGIRLTKVEKAQKRSQSLFFAQFSDKDIEKLNNRAKLIEARDSLFQ